MKNLLALLFSIAIATLNYGQQQSMDLSLFDPPLQDDYLIPIHSLTIEGDTLMNAEVFYQTLVEKGKPSRIFQNEQYILGMPKGITYLVHQGTPVYAVGDGKLSNIRPDAFRDGYWLQVRHANGLKSEYITLDQLQVEKGQRVAKGELLGYTSQEHFHFQFKIKKQILDAPAHFYQKGKIVVKAF